MAGGLMAPMISCGPGETKRTNWAANYVYKAGKLYEPSTVEEVQKYVRDLRKAKALGTRHCFNSIADSSGSQIALSKLDKIVGIDKETQTVTVEAGVTYGKLGPYLYQEGFALHNLASLPHISVVGACATATHGSGMGNGNLATAVSAIEMVNGLGEVVQIDRQHPDFFGAVVGLGALGVITKVTLDIQPAFMVRQDVYQHLPLESLKNHFEEIMSGGYSVSLFTDWQKQEVSQVWVKRKVEPGQTLTADAEYFGAKAATRNMHPIEALSAENCTDQMGVEGPWHERLPHFKMNFTPSSGEELQAEYFVARANAVEAILALERLRDQITPHLHISEIRSIDGDAFWLSMCNHQPSIAIHFTFKKEWDAVSKLLPVIESTLAPLRARPHWGKLFTYDKPAIQSLYDRMPDFVALANRYDPAGKFRNEFLDGVI